MRTLLLLLMSALLAFSPVAIARSHSSSSKSSKAVNVRTYTRKDGTVVQSHTRSAPGTAKQKASPAPKATKSYCASCERDSHGKIKRSESAKHEFQRTHACPSTGKTSGACPGYVIDHVVPLKRGGADSPQNMQWQTVAQAKAKDRIED